jgi:hypothetical protein
MAPVGDGEHGAASAVASLASSAPLASCPGSRSPSRPADPPLLDPPEPGERSCAASARGSNCPAAASPAVLPHAASDTSAIALNRVPTLSQLDILVHETHDACQREVREIKGVGRPRCARFSWHNDFSGRKCRKDHTQVDALTILLIALNLVWIIPFAVFVTRSGRAQKRSREQRRRLLEAGQGASATVLELKESGPYYGRVPHLDLRVRVEPPGEPSFEASARGFFQLTDFARLQPGSRIEVRFSPDDRSKVAVVGDLLS